MLEFEHIVQINDPDDSRVKPLSREQLWSGLLLRARDPGRFNSALSCRISNEKASGFIRHVQAGTMLFRESVTLEPLRAIHTRTSGDQEQLRAESITTIEEPASGYLFVRFIYRREVEQDPDEVLVSEHLKSAYRQLDLDAIALIRLMAEENYRDTQLH